MDAVQLVLLILKNTTLQFAWLIGTLAVSGAILTWLARRTTSVYRQFLFPNFGLYLFGSLGIPVHEFSHYLFCKLFRLEVEKIKWFDPKGRGGAHGAVIHRYDPWNVFHRIGHIFVGFAPVLVAPVLIGALCVWLLPVRPSQLWPMNASVWPALTALGTAAATPTLGGVICLYAVFAISSHLDLSREDMKVAVSGFIPLFVVLLCVNLLAAFVHADIHSWLRIHGTRALTIWAWILGLTGIASAIHLLLAFAFTSLIHVIARRESINPFRS